MKIGIIGAGDLDKISKYSKISPKGLKKLVSEVIQLLIDFDSELIILPARGIPYEFAKLYKQKGGKKVFGVIPAKCPFYGKYTENIIGPYRDVIDEEIEFNSWYDVDGNIATLGDLTLCFGLSAGVAAEISEMKYNLKFKNRNTQLIIFKNTISRRLNKEIEEDIKPIYVNSALELKKFLK